MKPEPVLQGGNLLKWAKRKPVCQECGEAVSRPAVIGNKLRGVCHKHGRVDAEWVER